MSEAVRLYMLVPVDLPKPTQMAILEQMPALEVQQTIHMSGKQLMNRVHNQIAWVIRNGYADLNFVVQIGAKDGKEEVGEPVAQHPTV